MAIKHLNHFRGSILKIDIFCQGISAHNNLIANKADESFIMVNRNSSVRNSDRQGISRVYQLDLIRASKRNSINDYLIRGERADTGQVLSESVIVEAHFGRLSQPWTVLSNKYECNEAINDHIFRFCPAFTN